MFAMPNPDVSFVSRERLKQNPRTYLSVIPELIVEIKSSRDRIRELEEKIALFLERVGRMPEAGLHVGAIPTKAEMHMVGMRIGTMIGLPAIGGDGC